MTDEMNQAFMKRLDEHRPQLPDKPVILRGVEPPGGINLPVPRVAFEFGGFTIVHGNHMIVFRYNIGITTVPRMLYEIHRTYLLEFIVRDRLGDSTAILAADYTADVDPAEIMQERADGGLIINLWNHTLERDLRERFIALFRR